MPICQKIIWSPCSARSLKKSFNNKYRQTPMSAELFTHKFQISYIKIRWKWVQLINLSSKFSKKLKKVQSIMGKDSNQNVPQKLKTYLTDTIQGTKKLRSSTAWTKRKTQSFPIAPWGKTRTVLASLVQLLLTNLTSLERPIKSQLQSWRNTFEKRIKTLMWGSNSIALLTQVK